MKYRKFFWVFIALSGFLFSCILMPFNETPSTTSTTQPPVNPPPELTTNFTFGTYTVTGYEGAISASPIYTYSVYSGNITLADPSNLYIRADSFVLCRGSFTADEVRYPYMYIRAYNTNTGSSVTDYKIVERGAFSTVVFLRHGPGVYKISLLIKDSVDDVLYVAGYFWVTNTSPYDLRYMMPSASVQSLDDAIRAKALEITAGCTNDSQRALSIHDWVVLNLKYDNDGIALTNDAKEAFDKRTVVCQGYSCLTAAFFRALGMPAKYVRGYVRSSTNEAWPAEITHAWNEVYYNGKWNIMDTTWDDPLIGGTSDYTNGYNLRYTYFEPELSTFYQTHTNWIDTDYRNLIAVEPEFVKEK